MLRFQCPRCYSILSAPDTKAGTKTNCPKCRQRLQSPRRSPRGQRDRRGEADDGARGAGVAVLADQHGGNVTAAEKPTRCRSCHTPTDKTTRGVCRDCYSYYRNAVARGETTWAELERAGLTLPARKPNLKRRWRAAELRAQGLSLAEIGREMGCTRQAVYQLLRPPRARTPQPRKRLACAACGADLGPALTLRDYDPPLCLPCLARQPQSTLGQRVRARRIARRLGRMALARRAGVSVQTVLDLEQGKHRPQLGTLQRLAAALGVEVGELQAGDKQGLPQAVVTLVNHRHHEIGGMT